MLIERVTTIDSVQNLIPKDDNGIVKVKFAIYILYVMFLLIIII